MALTVTVLNSALSLSTPGSALGAVKTTFAATSTAFRLHAKLTNGANSGNPQSRVVIRYVVSPFSLTTAQAQVQLNLQAGRLEVVPNAVPAGVSSAASELLDAFGTYLYTWLEAPAFVPAATIDLSLVEG